MDEEDRTRYTNSLLVPKASFRIMLTLSGSLCRLNDMPEMEREQILAQRQDEMQSRNDKLNLSKLLAAQDLGSMADDSVAQAAKRK